MVFACIATYELQLTQLLSVTILTLVFLHSLFPEYYEFIKNPVDLSTVKDQLSKYETVEECLGDIRQIWENCRLFNAEGSEISSTADLLQTELEELVEVQTCLPACLPACLPVLYLPVLHLC